MIGATAWRESLAGRGLSQQSRGQSRANEAGSVAADDKGRPRRATALCSRMSRRRPTAVQFGLAGGVAGDGGVAVLEALTLMPCNMSSADFSALSSLASGGT